MAKANENSNGKNGAMLARVMVFLMGVAVTLIAFTAKTVYCGAIEQTKMKIRSEMADAALLEKVTDLQEQVKIIRTELSGNKPISSVSTAGGN